jgi:hypothetical protein
LTPDELSRAFGIEQQKSGQREWSNNELESIQIKAILNRGLKTF